MSGQNLVDDEPTYKQTGGLDGVSRFFESEDGFWLIHYTIENDNGNHWIRLFNEKCGTCLVDGHTKPEDVSDMIETMFATRYVHADVKGV